MMVDLFMEKNRLRVFKVFLEGFVEIIERDCGIGCGGLWLIKNISVGE